jgi:hypothetical protein
LLDVPVDKTTADAALTTKQVDRNKEVQPAGEVESPTKLPAAVNGNAAGNAESTPGSGEPAATLKPEMTPTPPEHSPQEVPGIFNIFIDGFGKGIALTSIEGTSSLHIVDVEGGPIGLWNSRPHTKKAQVGDLVVRVRKAGLNQEAWIDNDFLIIGSGGLDQIEGLLESSGPFEVQLKHTEPKGQQQLSPISEPALEAAAKATEEDAEVAGEKVDSGVSENENKVNESCCGFWSCSM